MKMGNVYQLKIVKKNHLNIINVKNAFRDITFLKIKVLVLSSKIVVLKIKLMAYAQHAKKVFMLIIKM